MLPDIGWWEFLMVAMIAIIVVGPKDLPKLMRAMGKWMAKARAAARQFQRGFEEMAEQAEVEELKSEIRAIRENNPIQQVKNEIDASIAGLGPSLHEEKRRENPDYDLGEKSADDTSEDQPEAAPDAKLSAAEER